jgi:hypothetical protein
VKRRGFRESAAPYRPASAAGLTTASAGDLLPADIVATAHFAVQPDLEATGAATTDPGDEAAAADFVVNWTHIPRTPARTGLQSRPEPAAVAQWPVGGMFEEWPFCASRFTRFAVCFSLSVLPFFFTLALLVEPLDMISLSLAEVGERPVSCSAVPARAHGAGG